MAESQHATRRDWSRNETLAAFNLYLRTPFGRLHARNPEIAALARVLGRSPGSVAMKCCNLAALDPTIQQKGLQSTSALDRTLWDEFHRAPEDVGYQTELAFAAAMGLEPRDNQPAIPPTPSVIETDREVLRKVRITQRLFRETILAGYAGSCAICTLSAPALLVASHIVGWAVDAAQRMNPRNGICLCSMHDRAFDTGIIDISDKLTVRVTGRCELDKSHRVANEMIYRFDGQAVRLPQRWLPDLQLLQRRREIMRLDDQEQT
jgi:predicted restriction endonuclease